MLQLLEERAPPDGKVGGKLTPRYGIGLSCQDRPPDTLAYRQRQQRDALEKKAEL